MVPLIVRLGKTTWWHMKCLTCSEKFDYKEGDGIITCPNCGTSNYYMWIREEPNGLDGQLHQ